MMVGLTQLTQPQVEVGFANMKVRVIEKYGLFYPQYRRWGVWHMYVAVGYNYKKQVCKTKEEAIDFIRNTEGKVVAEFKI